MNLSIILPARNEADSLAILLPKLRAHFGNSEVIVVDDGSTDATSSVCAENGARVISHPYCMGNGAAIKTGARNASGDVFVLMDADGQHDPADIDDLIAKLDEGYDLVVGARRVDTHASLGRRIANNIYNRLASYMTGHRIEDLTSGFRVVRAQPFRRFLYLLPNGFSYPTTSTMAFFRSALPVAYVPIRALKREGRSKIKLVRDGVRFLVIIVKIGALFSPMRLFLPISGILFLLGLGYYGYTYVLWERFTNMSALLFSSSLLTFLMGVISEQISALHYKGAPDNLSSERVTEAREDGCGQHAASSGEPQG